MASWSREYVVAAKRHMCLWCKGQIGIGEQYVLESYVDGNYHDRNRYHAECAAAMNTVDPAELDWWNDEGCVPQYHKGSKELAC